MLRPLLRNRQAASDPGSAIELVERCLQSAIECGASDIHFHPRRESWDVSFRIDGVLQPAVTHPRCPDSDPVSRLMSMAGLPSYRGGVPLEGSLCFTSHEGDTREMRLGVFPTVHGNRAALRVTEPQRVRQLEQLGLESNTHEQLQMICEARDGWLLVAGPAGSGKTTTLYACLNAIAQSTSRRSVMTIEDPVEAVIDSISQSQLQPTGGLTLAAALKAAVRQDAEVLLVSEIRDEATAEAVLSASMTGHLCFSSIHAATIGATLSRLVQMQLPSFAIRSGLRGILCQRLLRQVCSSCANDANPNCETCYGTGYRGRFPIAQLIDLQNSPLEDDFLENQTARQLDKWVQEQGVESLREQATTAIAQGRTDEAEVFRVLGIEHVR